jgi:hypothetical protein
MESTLSLKNFIESLKINKMLVYREVILIHNKVAEYNAKSKVSDHNNF